MKLNQLQKVFAERLCVGGGKMFYDIVHSSYDFGPGMWNKTFHAHIKDICANYWIDPSGRLFELSWSGTQDFVSDVDGNVITIPNGNRGRVCVSNYSGSMELWIANWKAWYAPTPCLTVFFELGEVGHFYPK